MKRLALLFTLILSAGITGKAFGQFTQAEFVKEWQRAKNYTKAYLDAMPEDGYKFKPTPEIRSFAQQMLHLADANFSFASLASGKASPYGHNAKQNDQLSKAVPETKEAVTKAVVESYDFAINALQGMTPEQLNSAVSLMNFTMTRFALFGKAFEHQTHHRGQTTIYLRLKGVTPPGEMLF